MTDYTPEAREKSLAWPSLLLPPSLVREVVCFVGAFVGALLLYLPFLSIQFDINGIIEAQAVERGGTYLFSPNRLLYRAIGALGYELTLQSSGRSLPLLQFISAFLSTVAIAVFCVVTYRLTKRMTLSFWATALLATSWSFWAYSTDAYYITPAALAIFCALALLIPATTSLRAAIGAGVFVCLGILLWQANIFAIPLCLGLLLFYAPRRAGRRRRTNALAFLAVAGGLTAASYLAAAATVHGLDNGEALLGWLLSHGSDRFGRPPIWGVWSLDRVPATFVAAISSWIPIWDGLGLRKLAQGQFQLHKVIPQLSLVALGMLGALLSLELTRWKSARPESRRLGWLLLAGYLAYIPFVVWWDPAPKWFVIPNAFLILMAALMLSRRFHRRNPGLVFLYASLVAIIAAANLSTSVYPRHTMPGPEIPVAECFVQATTAQDVLVPLDWAWTEYATYLFGYSGTVLGLPPDLSAIGPIRAAIESAERLGGSVYVVDKRDAPLDAKQRIRDTGYALDAVLEFEHQPAFVCGDLHFARLQAVP